MIGLKCLSVRQLSWTNDSLCCLLEGHDNLILWARRGKVTLVLYIEAEVNWQEQINLYLGLLTELKNNKGRGFLLCCSAGYLSQPWNKNHLNLWTTQQRTTICFAAINAKLTAKEELNKTRGWTLLLCSQAGILKWDICLKLSVFQMFKVISSVATGHGVLPWTFILRL